ncbi:aspartyl-phosphate phosphatase Spo0E family protein [Bacillus spongiae]|uniref:Aspartyl-phosphate phosphatase Spo0E family protein n=1 Tax=Bacillus spongiae TaxID=2683610 RepID=A0ABU8H9D7_9BACI
MDKYSFERIDTLIEKKRQQMIQVGLAKGLSSEETVTLSKQLDRLLNIHSRRYLLSKNWSTSSAFIVTN